MKVFFQKHTVELKESTALKMIHKKVESAEEKCKAKDEEYLRDLAKAYEMIEDYFNEIEVNPASLL
ncbi:hypothetical protein [Flavobacterium phage FL-1]|nr:hypothetical protein [Flavobacterium phage FL-1]